MKAQPVTVEKRRQLSLTGLVTLIIGLLALALSWGGAQGDFLGFVGIVFAAVGLLLLAGAWLARVDRSRR